MSNPPPIAQDPNTPRQPLRFEDIDDLVTTQLMQIEATPFPNKGAKMEAQVGLLFSALNEVMYSLKCLHEEKRIQIPS